LLLIQHSAPNTQDIEIVLLSNGPGELYTWAGPMLRELRTQAPDVRVSLGLLPCPFASGHEERIARGLGFDAISSVTESLAYIAGGPKPAAFAKKAHGLVIGLGGDVSFPGRIGSRLGYPAWRYSFEPYWKDGLEKLFVHDKRTLEKAKKSGPKSGLHDKLENSIENIGNLTADALAFQTPAQKESGLDVLIMPGSRKFEVEHMLGLFAAAAEKIAQNVTGPIRFHWPRSRLLTEPMLEVARSGKKILDLGGVTTRLEGDHLVTPNGTRIRVADESDRYALMKMCDLALTIPGTNTLELGIANCPSIVALPLQKSELIPIENPLRYLEHIPIVGPRIKRRLVEIFLSRFKHVSLPNMIADEAIQLELRGDVTPALIASHASKLLENPDELARIRSRLNATMPQAGTAAKLVARALERIGLNT
jgi:Lipid-A-disaccharide synthetase